MASDRSGAEAYGDSIFCPLAATSGASERYPTLLISFLF